MSLTMGLTTPFLIGLAVSFLASPIAIWLAPKIGAVDIPKDNRRMHTKPMPRFGGLAIFAGVMVALLFTIAVALPGIDAYQKVWETTDKQLMGLVVGGVLIYLVGITDDLWGMPAKVKFLCQVGCASVAYAFGIRMSLFGDLMPDIQGHIPGVVGFLITVVWIVGITNTINLIDGLDGLAAGISTIACFSIAYTAYIFGVYTISILMLCVAGATLGFLPFNFHPAKIFMGDGGSLFLGFMIASISIIGPVKSATLLAIAIPLLVLGVPIFDTAFAILRRLANHRPIMEADKGHLHHRLMAAGLGQRRAVLTLYGISGIMGVAAIVFSRNLYLESAGLFILAANFIYVYLTDASSPFIKVKAVNTVKIEKQEKKAEAKAQKTKQESTQQEACEKEAEALETKEADAEKGKIE